MNIDDHFVSLIISLYLLNLGSKFYGTVNLSYGWNHNYQERLPRVDQTKSPLKKSLGTTLTIPWYPLTSLSWIGWYNRSYNIMSAYELTLWRCSCKAIFENLTRWILKLSSTIVLGRLENYLVNWNIKKIFSLSIVFEIKFLVFKYFYYQNNF